MKIQELKPGLRVRIPATEKPQPGGGKSYHYAYVRDIVTSLFRDGQIVLVSVPALNSDKAVHPDEIIPARKTQPKKTSEK